ncbi:DUF192 domain-containing protein [Fulvivirgaceae bacterium BMA10]|uniref:DUF192 domain-containing protein n=1 Tax=Splendidivirga corallicola TaxID=3051826 RepID=A0ABT8KTY2_9BACT|nr:DUF192 domain-containing protein [Fulvivirgaceae bacterium BMA10]
MMKKKTKAKVSEQSKSQQPIPKNNRRWFILISLVVVLLISLKFIFDENKTEEKISIKTKANEPQFVKEGELSFVKGGSDSTITKINIEVADNNADRAQGLMNRSSMEEIQGMLFIFEEEAERSFWMKNTLIPLDILYVNAQKEIVTIYKHTIPYSENSIPSFKEAKYVVEVVAGFCDKYNVKEGDIIKFELGNI